MNYNETLQNFFNNHFLRKTESLIVFISNMKEEFIHSSLHTSFIDTIVSLIHRHQLPSPFSNQLIISFDGYYKTKPNSQTHIDVILDRIIEFMRNDHYTDVLHRFFSTNLNTKTESLFVFLTNCKCEFINNPAVIFFIENIINSVIINRELSSNLIFIFEGYFSSKEKSLVVPFYGTLLDRLLGFMSRRHYSDILFDFFSNTTTYMINCNKIIVFLTEIKNNYTNVSFTINLIEKFKNIIQIRSLNPSNQWALRYSLEGLFKEKEHTSSINPIYDLILEEMK